MKKRELLAILLLGCMILAGCGGIEATMPAEAPAAEQEAIDTPSETPVPEASEPEEETESEAEAEPEEEEKSEPADNYYIHRFDSFDDLLYAYKEAQDGHYTDEQIELIFGYGEALLNYGWPDETSSYDVGYVYYDVDSDGTDEMIITFGNDIVEIYSDFTGKVQRFYSAPYGYEVTLYPDGMLKQDAPKDSEFPGTSWYSYDKNLAGYYKDFEESSEEYYTFCHHEFSGPEYDEIAARLAEDPDADMPVWIWEYEDMLSEAEYKKLLPKTKPVKLPEGKKLADVVLPADYEYRYEADEVKEDETIPEYFIYVISPDGYANLRTGPGTEYDVICQIPTGDSMEVYRETATDKKGKKWLKVAYWHPEGTSQLDGSDDPGVWETGWISESQVE
ncbi:MAG: SH3 domain-containing protein [Lachnospiraceae bacterium]|nr:SH3 domain-containing protein [Lachnospiraceae bacterium]